MVVFHGSNLEIENINLTKCNKYKDFGKGFYVTTIEEQAERMARRTVKRFGGVPTVTIFEFNEKNLGSLKYKEFIEVDNDWAMFIINNRDKDFKNITSELSNYDNKYDIVFGAVANDDIATTFALYKDGFLSSEILKERLKYKKLSNQYSFHTEEAIKLLKKVGVKKYE
ncbi:MAG: DUF3990 domain-containing protein [Lachnospiraceae bacterium]|jgi:hypothetical protein|nr:DUF3990 domain-containing protein [Lachnospiraceae bacterium]